MKMITWRDRLRYQFDKSMAGGAVALIGVYSLPKAAGEAMAEGAVAYWDGDKITATAAGNTKAGNVAEATAAAAATVAVRLAN